MERAAHGKCAACGHVDRSHAPRCKTCSCEGFLGLTLCPLKIHAHQGSRGRTCACVPGQMELDME